MFVLEVIYLREWDFNFTTFETGVHHALGWSQSCLGFLCSEFLKVCICLDMYAHFCWKSFLSESRVSALQLLELGSIVLLAGVHFSNIVVIFM